MRTMRHIKYYCLQSPRSHKRNTSVHFKTRSQMHHTAPFTPKKCHFSLRTPCLHLVCTHLLASGSPSASSTPSGHCSTPGTSWRTTSSISSSGNSDSTTTQRSISHVGERRKAIQQNRPNTADKVNPPPIYASGDETRGGP